MSARKKQQQPLTSAQQQTVLQWRPLACKYVLIGLRQRGLHHFMDEADGLAADALVRAVDVWEPGRGAFATCLKWWVRYMVRNFCAHGARVVHQPERATQYVDAWSLNAAVKGGNPDTRTHETWEDLLVDDSTEDPVENVDGRRLFRAYVHELPRRMLSAPGVKRTPKASAIAKESVAIWGARVLDGTELDDIAAPMGVSRQAVQQRVARVQVAFDKWARDIRNEAA